MGIYSKIIGFPQYSITESLDFDFRGTASGFGRFQLPSWPGLEHLAQECTLKYQLLEDEGSAL